MNEFTMIDKRGFKMDFGKEWLLLNSGFPQKGYWEEIPLTDEDRKAHARAKAALEELETNPWVMHGHEPHDLWPLTPKKTTFHAEETTEEWMVRWEEAGCPDFHADQMRKMVEANILSTMKSSTRAGFHRA